MMMITTIDYYDGADHDGGDDDLSEAFLREGEPPSEAEAGVCARLCVCVCFGQRVKGSRAFSRVLEMALGFGKEIGLHFLWLGLSRSSLSKGTLQVTLILNAEPLQREARLSFCGSVAGKEHDAP